MITVAPVTLESRGVRLEPLERGHTGALVAAARDGNLWDLWYTAIPAPDKAAKYVDDALAGQRDGTMLPFVVRDLSDGSIVGTTRYHDINAAVDRVEIGYTWYAESRQRTHVNRACKLMLLTHAFESLGCQVVGFRTDNFNFRSQAAIAGLGARKDGVIRHFQARRDGSARDTVMFSILRHEWPDVQRHLTLKLDRGVRVDG
jgi:RimJ/RimL family protein N-acetyltransferase